MACRGVFVANTLGRWVYPHPVHEAAQLEILAGAIFLISSAGAFASGLKFRVSSMLAARAIEQKAIARAKQRDTASREILLSAMTVLADARAVAASLVLEELDQELHDTSET